MYPQKYAKPPKWNIKFMSMYIKRQAHSLPQVLSWAGQVLTNKRLPEILRELAFALARSILPKINIEGFHTSSKKVVCIYLPFHPQLETVISVHDHDSDTHALLPDLPVAFIAFNVSSAL